MPEKGVTKPTSTESASPDAHPAQSAGIEALTRAYIETGVLYRHFGTSRAKLLGRYWLSVGAIAVAFRFTWTDAHLQRFTWIVLAAGCIITLVFWALELRHRQISTSCVAAASRIEEGLGLTADQGAYTRLRHLPSAQPAHSQTMNSMYLIAALGFLAGTIVTLYTLF